jgi:hypothetical protein
VGFFFAGLLKKALFKKKKLAGLFAGLLKTALFKKRSASSEAIQLMFWRAVFTALPVEYPTDKPLEKPSYFNRVTIKKNLLQRLSVDDSARISIKTAANCVKSRELQSYVTR